MSEFKQANAVDISSCFPFVYYIL